jgi:hypothetical protein
MWARGRVVAQTNNSVHLAFGLVSQPSALLLAPSLLQRSLSRCGNGEENEEVDVPRVNFIVLSDKRTFEKKRSKNQTTIP